MKKHYLGDGGIFRVNHRAVNSSCLSYPLHVKLIYLQGRLIIVGNGRISDFWRCVVCFSASTSLIDKLFYVCNKQSLLVAGRWPERICVMHDFKMVV
jgi:hypothetical protein